MPVVFWDSGYRFHFYSNEGDPREPVHVHVAKRGESDAKLWLYPEVEFAAKGSFDARAQRWIAGTVKERRAEIESAWHEHFARGD